MKYLLILILFIFLSIYILFIQFKFSETPNSIIPSNVYCSPMKGLKIASRMDFPTINYKTDKIIPCGFYIGNTSFGEGVVISFGEMKNNHQNIEIHYLNYNLEIEQKKENSIQIYNLQPIEESISTFVKMFNTGCRESKR